LEMGESIRIAELARRLIELSGLIPDKDISIRFTGLRPGEKEYEEVMTEDENVVKTAHDRIWVLKKNHAGPRPPVVDLKRVEALVTANDGEGLRRLAMEYVPENHLEQRSVTGATANLAAPPQASLTSTPEKS
jgi:FlaA1/EpsC-like NDP-sugar epimerase